MPFIPVPHVAQVHIRATYLGEQIENVLNFRSAFGEITPAGLAALGDLVGDAWTLNMLNRFCNQYLFREVFLVDLTTVDSENHTWVVDPPVVGGIAEPPEPGNVAMCLTHRTTRRGRSYRGRTFLSGFGEQATAGNYFVTEFANGTLTAFRAFIAAVENSGDWAFVVVSRQLDGVVRENGVATSVDATVLRDYAVDSQRRRLANRGR